LNINLIKLFIFLDVFCIKYIVFSLHNLIWFWWLKFIKSNLSVAIYISVSVCSFYILGNSISHLRNILLRFKRLVIWIYSLIKLFLFFNIFSNYLHYIDCCISILPTLECIIFDLNYEFELEYCLYIYYILFIIYIFMMQNNNQINFHPLIDLSSLVLINNPLSSNNSKDLTISVCPSKLATNEPDFHSHILIVLSNEAVAIKSLSIV